MLKDRFFSFFQRFFAFSELFFRFREKARALFQASYSRNLVSVALSICFSVSLPPFSLSYFLYFFFLQKLKIKQGILKGWEKRNLVNKKRANKRCIEIDLAKNGR